MKQSDKDLLPFYIRPNDVYLIIFKTLIQIIFRVKKIFVLYKLYSNFTRSLDHTLKINLIKFKNRHVVGTWTEGFEIQKYANK